MELVFEGVLWWKRTGETGPLWISLLMEREDEGCLECWWVPRSVQGPFSQGMI